MMDTLYSVTNMLAGYCLEPTAWQWLFDMADILSVEKRLDAKMMQPSCIVYSEGRFVLDDGVGQVAPDRRFCPPEGQQSASLGEKSLVWSLGAVAFYMVMGNCVFGNRGGVVMVPSSKIPYLRPDMPELGRFVASCLSYDPLCRPSLMEVKKTAETNLSRCREVAARGPRRKSVTSVSIPNSSVDEVWPEEMVPFKHKV